MQNQNNITQGGTAMEYSTTIGVDVSDRTSKICVMAKLMWTWGMNKDEWNIKI